jgi:DNA segregation ATPase FtsK/SpoIIIE-like protein
MQTLYEIAAEYRSDLDKLADMDLTPEAIKDTIEGLSGALETKAQNIGFLVQNLDNLASSIKEAEQQMAKRRKAIENRIQHIKDYTLNVLEANGISKVETPYFKIAVVKNPPSVEVYDEKQVPTLFMRQPETPPPEIDKKTILECLKMGGEVAGCRLSQSTRLQIK